MKTFVIIMICLIVFTLLDNVLMSIKQEQYEHRIEQNQKIDSLSNQILYLQKLIEDQQQF